MKIKNYMGTHSVRKSHLCRITQFMTVYCQLLYMVKNRLFAKTLGVQHILRTLEYEILTMLEWVILPTCNLMAFLCILHYELFSTVFHIHAYTIIYIFLIAIIVTVKNK